MTDMTLGIMPTLMNDDVRREMDKMLDGNGTYKDIVEYLAENDILTSPTALNCYKHGKDGSFYSKLEKDIEYAKRSKSRELLHEAYGALKMAYNLGAISYAEFTVLQIKAVREGLNNASIWR